MTTTTALELTRTEVDTADKRDPRMDAIQARTVENLESTDDLIAAMRQIVPATEELER